jgi:hypothetical protein
MYRREGRAGATLDFVGRMAINPSTILLGGGRATTIGDGGIDRGSWTSRIVPTIGTGDWGLNPGLDDGQTDGVNGNGGISLQVLPWLTHEDKNTKAASTAGSF